MKWFCQIFALYIFGLSFFPCTDGEHGHGSLSGETVSLLKSAADNSGHEHCNDLCSPLCQCSCCGCALTNVKPPVLQIALPVLNEGNSSLFTYQAPFSTIHRSALFRPPINKLG